MRKISALTLIGVFVSQTVLAAPSAQEKKTRLDEILTRQEDKARTMRYVGSGVVTAIGIGSIVYGSGSSVSDKKSWQIIGSLLTVGGIAGFFVPSEQERFVETYRAHSGEGDLSHKVTAGETLFRYKAEETERMRKGMGVFSTAFGSGLIIYAATQDSLSSGTSTTYYVIGGGMIVGGIVSLLIKSEFEKDYDDYRSWAQGGSKTAATGLSNARFALAPVLDDRGGTGAWGGVTLDF